MQNVEANISNTKRPLYDGIQPENICYQVFDDDIDDDDVVLPYGQRIKDKNTEEVDQAYVENLEKIYIDPHCGTWKIFFSRPHKIQREKETPLQ